MRIPKYGTRSDQSKNERRYIPENVSSNIPLTIWERKEDAAKRNPNIEINTSIPLFRTHSTFFLIHTGNVADLTLAGRGAGSFRKNGSKSLKVLTREQQIGFVSRIIYVEDGYARPRQNTGHLEYHYGLFGSCCRYCRADCVRRLG